MQNDRPNAGANRRPLLRSTVAAPRERVVRSIVPVGGGRSPHLSLGRSTMLT